MKIRQFVCVTQEFSFEMAHALDKYLGPCRNIHGHSYKFSITVKGAPVNDDMSNNNGMVVDFCLLKEIVEKHLICKFDHALVMKNSSHLASVLRKELKQDRVIWVGYQPTCENILLEFVRILKKQLPKGLIFYSACLRESPDSYVEWFADDNL